MDKEKKNITFFSLFQINSLCTAESYVNYRESWKHTGTEML